ncbi:nitrogenase component 1 [Methanogenium organophilum]|uniref:Nitrogenase n=1 Tax=Methanogenium organophilum TaxID=2199 RepID=A0A9X9S5Y8_METOG|nr:nitrogenase component 1 [Methanogenium organophilum]WAI02296.1 nitrogenase [Methanogenium organophilum]
MTESSRNTCPDTVKLVNENQCHMCMPLGGVIAFKGVEDTMVLVHGSQGCSTYMRLTNVEHYHEPVDVASSSLNEKQTIYGGEKNLKKALDNVIRVYEPKVIGVLTTCLTETMGEDLNRIIASWRTETGNDHTDIIPVSTPSYDKSHTEGFWTTTREIIAYYAKSGVLPHARVNVIIPHISTADIRAIQQMLELWGVAYTMLPDYSMTLDRPFAGKYLKIPEGGTSPTEIAEMGGAPLTIQFGCTCDESISPGAYLRDTFGVPLVNLPLPVGIENTDRFMQALEEHTGRPVPDRLRYERGWLIDAMADSHKYNASARPVIYGEPELVYAYTCACMENGAVPSVIATGTPHSHIGPMLKERLTDAIEMPVILEGADFSMIEKAALDTGSTIAIGHSGGRQLAEKHGIPIVRAGFPIHDRVGGQRILSVGYAGSLAFLDRFTNTILEKKYASYRTLRREELLSKIAAVPCEGYITD